ncbi:MAG: hypothetical protein ACC618_01815 [Patescibacteria group bacterium]
MARIKRIGIKQTAKFAAIFYFVVTLIFFVPFFLITLLIGTQGDTEGYSRLGGAVFGGVFLLILPFFYALLVGLVVAVSAYLYNLIAKRIGGIEVEIETDKSSEESQPKTS